MKMNRSTTSCSLLFLLAILMLSTGRANAQVTVQKWYEGRDGAFTLTFDDGTKSHYVDLRPVLNKYNLKGTFYLNTSLLSENPVENAFSGSWDEFRTMWAEGHEMGSHGVNHPDLTTLASGDSLTPNTLGYELWESRRVIEEKIGNGYRCITHAYPFCTNNTIVQEVTARYYASARTCGSLVNPATPNYYAVSCQGYDWATTRKSFFDDFGQLKAFLNSVDNSVISTGKWGVLLCHEVLPFAEANVAGTWEPTTLEWMIEASKGLQQRANSGKLWVGTFADVTRYAKERDAFYYAVIAEDEEAMSMLVADDLDNTVFDFPLTLDITVPVTWKKVKVIQGAAVHNYSATGGDPNIVRAGVVPLEDTIEIIRLPDDQLMLESAQLTAPGNEIMLSFNSKVKLSEGSDPGISVILDHLGTCEITALSYVDNDSLELRMSLGTMVYSGSVLSLVIENSEISSLNSSQLCSESGFPVINSSEQLEGVYKILSVASKLIERDEQSADVNIYVFATSGFSLQLESDWCSLAETSGSEYDTIQVHFDSNPGIEARTDTIHIHSEDGFDEIIVLTQAGIVVSVDNKISDGNHCGELQVYPSPARDILNLQIPDKYALPAILNVVSASGQRLKSMEISDPVFSISLDDLSPGYYFVELLSGEQKTTERFVIR